MLVNTKNNPTRLGEHISQRIVAIHQPNFFPWLGFFDKIIKCDVFVLLDSVLLPKTGGTWGNRVKLIVGGEPKWITMPIDRSYHGYRRVNEIKIDNSTDWRSKITKTIQMNYGKTQYFKQIMPIIETLISNPSDNLADYNIETIRFLSKMLGMPEDKFVLSSSLNIESKSNNLLIDITKAVGGTTYMCGGGTATYQNDSLFKESEIHLVYQNFQHPIYSQKTSKVFVYGLSILDSLFNIGSQRTRETVINLNEVSA